MGKFSMQIRGAKVLLVLGPIIHLIVLVVALSHMGISLSLPMPIVDINMFDCLLERFGSV